MRERHRLALYIDPPSDHFLRDRLFAVDDGRLTGDRILAPYAHVRCYLSARGIPVRTADYLPDAPDGATNIYVSMGIRRDYRRLASRPETVLSAFFAMECPVVEPSLYRALPKMQRHFKRIYSWSDGASLEPFVGTQLRCEPFRWPQAYERVHEEIWRQTDRKFLVMINANKAPQLYRQELYTERLRAVEFFGRSGEIDLYGAGWDGPSHRVGRTWVPNVVRRVQGEFLRRWQRIRPDPLLVSARRVHRGITRSKAETLGRYTFAICFENMILKGWITEKIFDCFFAGTVPIYLGAPDIGEYVPAECFIDMRQFADYGDLRTFLKSLGRAEIDGYRQRARDFLQSPQFRPFTKNAFADLFRRIIEEDSGVPVAA